jgi:hypothetical protein
MKESLKLPREVQEERIREVANEIWPGCEVCLDGGSDFIRFYIQTRLLPESEPVRILTHSEERPVAFWAGMTPDGVREHLNRLWRP